jgi:hypothetical protein
MFAKNAAKLHFYFQLAKYLSKNSQNNRIFFHFVNSTCHFSASFDSCHTLFIIITLAKLLFFS